jgi:uncharacterized protein (TIGR02452 family)
MKAYTFEDLQADISSNTRLKDKHTLADESNPDFSSQKFDLAKSHKDYDFFADDNNFETQLAEATITYATTNTTAATLLSKNADQRVGIINLANEFSLGGGVFGNAAAQEEDVARASNLLYALYDIATQFTRGLQKHSRPTYSQRWQPETCFYSENVSLYANENSSVNAGKVSVMSVAAPNLRNARPIPGPQNGATLEARSQKQITEQESINQRITRKALLAACLFFLLLQLACPASVDLMSKILFSILAYLITHELLEEPIANDSPSADPKKTQQDNQSSYHTLLTTDLYKHYHDWPRYTAVMRAKCYHCLLAAKENVVQHLVLGALGCGAFRNEPNEVAKIWQEVLSLNEFQNAFISITFAICNPKEPNAKELKAQKAADRNFAAFHHCFTDSSSPLLSESIPNKPEVVHSEHSESENGPLLPNAKKLKTI